MLKFVDKKITFEEIPDEISLCYSISNCDGLCEGCHSAELRDDIGTPLAGCIFDDAAELRTLGVTCICLLGEGAKDKSNKSELIAILKQLRTLFPELKLALYSGKIEMDKELCPYLDYYKVGPYIASCGPLNSRTTNQKLYKIVSKTITDITFKFWEDDYEDNIE